MKRTPSNPGLALPVNLVLIGILLIGIWRGQAPFDTVIRLPSLLLILVVINTLLIFRESLCGSGGTGGCAPAGRASRSAHLERVSRLRRMLNTRISGSDESQLPADALGTLLGSTDQAAMALYTLDESGAFAQLATCGALPAQLTAARFVVQNGELVLRHPAGLGDEVIFRWETAPRHARHASAVTVLTIELVPLMMDGKPSALLVSMPKPSGPRFSKRLDAETAGMFLEGALARWQSSIRATEGRAHDHQTGLQRFEWFKEAFEIEVERSERYHQNLTLMLVDLTPCDDLPAGQREALRQAVAAALRDSLRRLDQAFVSSRPGKFAAILTETGSDVAARVTERVRQAFATRVGDLRRLNPRLAIGTASYPSDATHGDGLREMAEEALAEAVKSGRPVVAYGSIHSGEEK
ncbi:MAG TPA: diguanylate cyclase [Candidatus Ozemobacteraceae bacterium]|nr:diguanylate cyclase [Candidatus Ozemobacteraceae bacterium]